MMTDPIAWPGQFQAHPLLQGLTAEQLDRLRDLMVVCIYPPGAEIVREGERSDELYFITAGAVALFKLDEGKQNQYQIGTLRSGMAFGEIAFIDAAPRTATVKALAAVQMLALSRSALEQEGAQTEPLGNRLKANIAQQLAGTLQNRTEAYVLNLQNQLATMRMMNEFGQLFVSTVGWFAAATLMNVLFSAYMKLDSPYWLLVSWGYLVLVSLPVAYLLWQSPQPLASFGVTLVNWRRVVVEALVISGVALGVGCLLLWGYASLVGKPFLTFFSVPQSLAVSMLYLPHCYIQEFIGRGVLQNSLRRFFMDERGLRTIVGAAVIFGMFHSHFGLGAMIITFFSGLFFGYLFLRQQNLLGVTLVHWLLGLLAYTLNLI